MWQEYTHNETTGFRVDLNISGQDTDVLGTECLFEVSKFLIRQCLDGTCVYGSVPTKIQFSSVAGCYTDIRTLSRASWRD